MLINRLFKPFLTAAFAFCAMLSFGQSDLIITAVYDATLPGGVPKGVELYALNNVSDLSAYGLGSANNGGGSDGEEFTFPAVSANQGDFIYVSSDSANFADFFGFPPNYTSSAMGINGDDAVELFQNGSVVDLYGEINVDGSGQAWEYADSWAYRSNGSSPSATFNTVDWIIPGSDALDGETSNATASQPVPVGTYDPSGGSTVTVYTIQEIQETTDPSGVSPVVGEVVETSGIVTAIGNGGFWIQNGTGSWSGIFVLDGSAIVSRGDDVTVQGSVQENFDLTRISASSVAVNSSGNPEPAATSVSTADANSEQYESVFISINGAICVNADAGFGEYVLNDGTGDYLADDLLFAFTPTLFAEYDAVGIGYYSFGNYKLLPRDADDIEDTGNDQLVVGFANETGNVAENAGTASVELQIVNPSLSSTSVDVIVTGGTAVNGVDYSFSGPVTVTFPASSTANESFSVSILDNTADDDNRTITFGLANPNNGALLVPDAFELTIIDDEITVTDIATVAEVDTNGAAINEGQEFTIQGRVLGGNFSTSGIQFTVIDATGGIGIFNFSPVSGYSPVEGDDVVITGTVDQFNGLTQLNPSSIQLVSQGNPIPAPTPVTSLGEDTESALVVFECATLIDTTQWDNSGSGFNVDVTNGTDTIVVRIDNDVDLYNEPAPAGEFDVVGIGGQFDFSSPFTSGYQLLPRSSADIQSSSCGFVCENPFPAVDEASLNTTFIGNAYLTEWDAVPNQIGCQLQVRLGDGTPLGATIVAGATADSFVIPGFVLQLGTTYEWRVRCGCSQFPLVVGPFSSWQEFTTPSGSGISSSPNPTQGVSFVSFEVMEEANVTLEVFDLSGRVIDVIFSGMAQPNTDYRFEFDGSDLPNGIYIYRLTTENEVVNEKFMIAH